MLCTVLPTIRSSQQADAGAGNVADAGNAAVLRGDLSAVPQTEPDAVRVYLCYDLEGDYNMYKNIQLCFVESRQLKKSTNKQ